MVKAVWDDIVLCAILLYMYQCLILIWVGRVQVLSGNISRAFGSKQTKILASQGGTIRFALVDAGKAPLTITDAVRECPIS